MGTGSWSHLAARFFDVLLARPLDEEERETVSGWLQSPEESGLFWSQAASDQRHGLEGALEVSRRVPNRVDLVRAALLHDVGKQEAGLGVVGRTMAELADKLSLEPGGRLGVHLRHDQIGAALLIGAGCRGVVVEFARHHHSARPSNMPSEEWSLLVDADRASMTKSLSFRGRSVPFHAMGGLRGP